MTTGLNGPVGGPWTTAVPSAPDIHNEPALAYSWVNGSQNQLDGMRDSLINLIVEQIVMALQGFVNAGEDVFDQLVAFAEQIPLIGPLIQALTGIATGTLETLTEWTAGIPLIGPLVRAITQFIDPDQHVDLNFLGDWFGDLLGIFGNPTGLGTGNAILPGVNNIPIIGPLLDTFLGWVQSIFGGVFGGNPLTGFFNILTDIAGLLGRPFGLGTGSPVVGSLGSIPLLGPIFQFAQNIIDTIIRAISGIPIIGAPISSLLSSVTGLSNTSNTANTNVNNLTGNLLTNPAGVIGSLIDNVIDGVGGTLGQLLNGIFAGNQPQNTPIGKAGGSTGKQGTGNVVLPSIPGAGADGASGASGYAAMQVASYQAYQQAAQAGQYGSDGMSGSAGSGYSGHW